MATVTLLQQRTRELHLRNDIKKQGQLQLRSNFNFNVKFASNNQNCVATLYQSFEDKSGEETLSVSVTLEGLFSCQGVAGDEDKKAVHVQAYDALFPYLQSTVGQLFSSTGFPGFMVKKIPLDEQKVVISQSRRENDPPTLPIV
ncbi:MAG: protein-export chaperone SecB [Clostridiales bacterium]|nr:protein-export chaperone SecB [Clostridiales bacterium]